MGCDSLNCTNNKIRCREKSEEVSPTQSVSNKNWYIAQTSQDALEVRVRFFTNLFNEQPSAVGVAKNYVSP